MTRQLKANDRGAEETAGYGGKSRKRILNPQVRFRFEKT
jgi:hypothetical protein